MDQQGQYDYATIHTLLNTCPVLHVSFNDPEHPFPVVLPMLGCTGSFSDPSSDPSTTTQDLYIHGYISSRLFKKGKEAGEHDDDQGLPITAAATFLDGLVLALSPFHNSCNYRSAVAYGYADVVTDQAEALYAMQLITDNMIPERWAKSRGPPTKAELSSTGILKVRIASASAKTREGGPSEDRADLKDAALVGRTWTGVVPFWGTWGEPVAGKLNGREEVEGYIEKWRVGETGRAREYAFAAIEKGN
ncbi:hypothetical protein N0V95_008339 [Ascochyta clinopodiicola]|nr:hypothetical protein N0V95_008339 [Ascochyta clinopodiicola]